MRDQNIWAEIVHNEFADVEFVVRAVSDDYSIGFLCLGDIIKDSMRFVGDGLEPTAAADFTMIAKILRAQADIIDAVVEARRQTAV